MHYTVHHCNAPHPATELDNKLPVSQALFSAADDAYMTFNPTDHAVAAYSGGRIIAVFKYRMRGTQLRACGTAVAKQYRGHGIAQALWRAALKKRTPSSVTVMVVSTGGYNLVQSMKRLYKGSGMRFYVEDDRRGED